MRYLETCRHSKCVRSAAAFVSAIFCALLLSAGACAPGTGGGGGGGNSDIEAQQIQEAALKEELFASPQLFPLELQNERQAYEYGFFLYNRFREITEYPSSSSNPASRKLPQIEDVGTFTRILKRDACIARNAAGDDVENLTNAIQTNSLGISKALDNQFRFLLWLSHSIAYPRPLPASAANDPLLEPEIGDLCFVTEAELNMITTN